MKKLATLLLAAGMVMGASAPASAADVKLDGFYRYTFQTASTGFQGKNVEAVQQRMRLGLTITASENLKGYTQFQIGTTDWGTSPKHGKADVQSRQYYIDWTVPGAPVKVRMGRSQLGLPADAFGGNTVLSAAWGPRDGIVVNTKAAEWLDVTALWTRAGFVSSKSDIHTSDHADVFALSAKLKFDGFSVEPWVAYSTIDEDFAGTKWDSEEGEMVWGFGNANGLNNNGTQGAADLYGYGSDSYYVGATATLTAFDPFKLVVSAAYGVREYTGAGDADPIAVADDDRKGWNVQAKASYKLGFGTPVLGAWYASGDDADDQPGHGQLPGINGYTTPTGTFFDGSTSLTNGVGRYNLLGTWGVQAGIEGMSFIKDLSHTATVTYIQGTNHTYAAGSDKQTLLNLNETKAYNYMTTSDSVTELALTTDYKIYKNLVATLELAYLINDFGAEVYDAYDEDDWRAGLTFTYKF